MTEHAVIARDVSRIYPSEQPVYALHGLTLEIERGEFVAIRGPSGSGKSTLLNLLGLLDSPTSGELFLFDRPVGNLDENERTHARRELIGFVFQSFELIAHQTVAENVCLPLMIRGWTRQAALERARETVAAVGLEDRADGWPSNLSGGERQRVAIARALASNAELFVCDEPTGNLDSTNQGAILDLLSEVNDSGTTMIVVTHDDSVASRAQRSIWLRDGRIEQSEKDVATRALD